MSKILVLFDRDNQSSASVCNQLTKERYQVDQLPLCDCLPETRYDMYSSIILDMRHSQATGKCAELCRKLKQRFEKPIVVLSENKCESDRLASLDSGADEYLSEPINLSELQAKLRAILRRHEAEPEQVLKSGDLYLDRSACRVRRGSENLKLFPMEFKLLEFFMKHPDIVFSSEVLHQRVWESNKAHNLDTVRTCIKTLRRKIDTGRAHCLLKTVYGKGYRFSGLRRQTFLAQER
jgi:two-component system, OmpR family, response regulator